MTNTTEERLRAVFSGGKIAFPINAGKKHLLELAHSIGKSKSNAYNENKKCIEFEKTIYSVKSKGKDLLIIIMQNEIKFLEDSNPDYKLKTFKKISTDSGSDTYKITLEPR